VRKVYQQIAIKIAILQSKLQRSCLAIMPAIHIIPARPVDKQIRINHDIVRERSRGNGRQECRGGQKEE
jgi:hypothetical protein